MKFKANSIRTLDRFLKCCGGQENITLGIKLDDLGPEKLVEIGFGVSPEEGLSIIPSVIGKFTSFNANGKEILRPDLPKEQYSVSYTSTTYDWHRNPHYGMRTRTAMRIAREHIPAPAIMISVAKTKNGAYITSPLLNLSEENSELNIHIINLMLECFDEIEILDTEKEPLITTKFKKMLWTVLPKGKYPWDEISKIIASNTQKTSASDSDREVIESRLKLINVYKPDFIATGHAGFNGYFIFGFESKNIYVLESIFLDNATYIFKKDWEILSQLTKAEIINGDLEYERIVHNKVWKRAIGDRLSKALRT